MGKTARPHAFRKLCGLEAERLKNTRQAATPSSAPCCSRRRSCFLDGWNVRWEKLKHGVWSPPKDTVAVCGADIAANLEQIARRHQGVLRGCRSFGGGRDRRAEWRSTCGLAIRCFRP